MRIECANPVATCKKAFYLAWQACGGPLGMGVFQDNSSATEEQVWQQVHREGQPCYGDYVFGRMMKLYIEYDDKSVTVRDNTPRHDYQAWCHKYPTYQSLIEAANATA